MRLVWVIPEVGHYHDARMQAACHRPDVEGCFVEVWGTSEFPKFRALQGNDTRYGLIRLGLCRSGRLGVGGAIERIGLALNRLRPDVVAVPGWSEVEALATLLWCGKAGVPAVLLSESGRFDARRVWWKERVKRRIVSLCGTAVVGGRRHVDYLVKLGMAGDRIFVGYDVVDNSHFAEGAAQARQRVEDVKADFGLPEQYFLAVARFVEKKNLESLLMAYRRYCDSSGDQSWHLVLLGDGELRAQLTQVVGRLGLERMVLMPGFRGYDELPAYYGLAGAFVHASVTEQWGLVVNEAMASGLPVIVSRRCGCVPELVYEGLNGFTFDPYDVYALAAAMAEIASDRCDRKVMGAASCEIVSRWSPELFAANLWAAGQAAMRLGGVRATVVSKALLRAVAWR